MTRKKVDPDKRRRVAQACDACKRSKLKCDGISPCKTCTNRQKPCTYVSTENGLIEEIKSKRRKLYSAHNVRSGPVKKDSESPNAPQNLPQSSSGTNDLTQQPNGTEHFTSVNGGATVYENEEEEQKGGPDNHSDSVLSRGSTVSVKDEEATVFNSTRMLQDPSERFLYIGDSGTLSFLSSLRIIVENVAGPSPFTIDPQRLQIVENPIGLPPKIRLTRLLPDKRTADILLEAYFVNTNGLVEVFNRKNFMVAYEKCYADPLSVEPSWLCLLYLAFAIGFVMATPLPKSLEDKVIQKLRADPVDQGEVFYSNAKQLADPSRGFEDEDFWSVQALALMTLYTLSISKRNAAYAYFGMAVRSAFALGLHRGETMCIFLPSVQSLRRNLWRSLFVLDRFLASCLGRPTAIRESDCSGDTFTTPEMEKPEMSATILEEATAGSLGLEASVRSCHIIGVVLEKVYSRRKVSTKLAQEIVDDCGSQKDLHPSLDFRQVASPNTRQGVAVLHVNLLFYHSILLLTRPFFLFLMHKKYEGKGNVNGDSQQSYKRMEHFGRYCVVVSCQSIAIIQSALASRFLPRRNPFVIYFLLASALIVLANEFSSLYQNPYAKIYIRNAIDIMQYCAETDPQARRLMFILTEFREVVDKQQAATSRITMQSFGHHTGTTTQTKPSVPITSSIVETHTTTSTIRTILNPNQADFINPPRSQAIISPSTTAPAPLLPQTTSNPNINPHVSVLKTSGPSTVTQPNSLELMNSSYFANYHSTSSSDPQNREPMILPLNSRQNSLDLYLDLSLLSGSGANMRRDMEADPEADFEKFWNWQSTASGFTPGGALGGAIAREHAMNGTTAAHRGSDAQRPMYGATNGDFETNPNFQGFG